MIESIRRIAGVSLGLGLGAVLWMACASAPPPEAPLPAMLSVRVEGGLPDVVRDENEGTAPVQILLDATPSMLARVSGRATRYDAARRLVSRVLDELPLDAPVELRVVGLTESACGPALPIVPGTDAAPAESLAALAPVLPPPRSESSLAAGLDAIGRALDRHASMPGAHVIVVSDFEPDVGCAGDPCASAAALVRRGAGIDAVAVGDLDPPACWKELAAEGPPRLPGLRVSGAEPSFRVERPPTIEGLETPQVLARGRAGGAPVAVAPGDAVIHVELVPPVAVGPIPLDPGSHARVRVLSFPTLDPPVREIWVETTAEALEP